MAENDELAGIDATRLGLTFHRTFYLKRAAVKQVIELIENDGEDDGEKAKIRRKDIRGNSQLGTIQVEAFPRWAWGIGILDQNKQFTTFGRYVRIHDTSMDQLSTLWLMHYHLSAPHGPGPTFWNQIVCSRFRSGDEFTQSEIEQDIAEIYSKEKGKPLSPGSAKSTANAFLETYVKSDGLGNLGILEEIGDNHYRVMETDIPPVWAVAAAVLDYWQANFPNQVTVNLNSLTSESGLASLFMISRSRLDMILGEMRDAGVVELFRVAPPYQVALLNSDMEMIFQRMYSHEPSA
ncbi:DUF4007 family protein [Levilinea saccharolytica]|uniref:DUF4007 domain-containing protein n=1 Tax=Levilinea saccharolytica TaxID=229921 RepID=A0A0P6XKK7_9CHLR|nr:DUF4007 family protein [Levilinea saccharolytica]KPL76596.1 hypothetical protein ADN01_16605 [Levilinea saccharolytica]GAP17321.1 hypothetical protein LSAC_01190 [Levilinea saccharolytica]